MSLLNAYNSFDHLFNLDWAFRYEVWREDPTPANGTPIQSLHDWSGKGHPVTNANPATSPQYLRTLGGGIILPNLEFNAAVGMFLNSGSIPQMNNTAIREYYIVSQPRNTPGGFNPVCFNGANTDADGSGDLSIFSGVFPNWLLRYAYKLGFSYDQFSFGAGASFPYNLQIIRSDGVNVNFSYGPGIANVTTPVFSTQVPNGVYTVWLGNLPALIVPSLAFDGWFFAAFGRSVVSTPAERTRILAYFQTIYGTPL